jgi:hypothetical protein
MFCVYRFAVQGEGKWPVVPPLSACRAVRHSPIFSLTFGVYLPQLRLVFCVLEPFRGARRFVAIQMDKSHKCQAVRRYSDITFGRDVLSDKRV